MADEKKTKAQKQFECIEKCKKQGMNIEQAIETCKELNKKSVQDKMMDVLFGVLILYVAVKVIGIIL